MRRQVRFALAGCGILLALLTSVGQSHEPAPRGDGNANPAPQTGNERRADLFRILKIVLQPPEDSAVCLVVSREFVNAFLAAPVSEDSTVGATILGTYVTGNAETVANLQCKLNPNEGELDLQIALAGQCDSNTVGGSGPVDVHTTTNADFTAVKRVRITPQGIHSHAADVNAHNLKAHPQVNSRVGGFIGRIATNIGQNVVARNHGQVVSESRAHLQQQIGAQVDGRVDQALGKLRQMVADARQSENSLFKRELQLRTTDKVLMLATGTIPAEVLRQADDAPDHEITLIVSRSLAERFGKAAQDEEPPRVDEASDERGRRLRLLARLGASSETWSDDGQWLTLRWNIDSERIAWMVKAADKLKTWVESIDQADGVATAHPPVEVRTGAEVKPPPAQGGDPVRFFPFEIEVETPATPSQPTPAAQRAP